MLRQNTLFYLSEIILHLRLLRHCYKAYFFGFLAWTWPIRSYIGGAQAEINKSPKIPQIEYCGFRTSTALLATAGPISSYNVSDYILNMWSKKGTKMS